MKPVLGLVSCNICVALPVALHLEFAFKLPSLGKFVSNLHLQPCFRRAAKGFSQPDCHLRADAGFAVDDVVESLPGDTENLRAFGA